MESLDVKFYFRKRYMVVFLVLLGMICKAILKSNLSIAVVEITSDKNITLGNRTFVQKAEFAWNSKQKGFILSALSYGHLPSCFLGGILATRYGGSTVFGYGLLLSAILSIASPYFIRSSFLIFAAARIWQGVGLGLMNGAYAEIYVQWAPPNERCRIIATAMIGNALGLAVSHSLCGLFAYYFSWEAIFYIPGAIVIVWCCVWFVFVRDRPEIDKLISAKEKNYLQNAINYVPLKMTIRSYPWMRIVKSKPAWALLNEFFCNGWSFSFTMYCIPLYIKGIIILVFVPFPNPVDFGRANIKNVGFISSIPAVCLLLSEIICSSIADYIRSHKILDIPKAHRIFISVGQIGTIIALAVVALWANFETSIALLSLIRVFFGIANTSYHVLPIDLFFRYAAIISGLCRSCFQIAEGLNPIIMGYMVADHTPSQWNLYFSFLVIFNVWSLLVYFAYGSGELQPWAVIPQTIAIDATTAAAKEIDERNRPNIADSDN